MRPLLAAFALVAVLALSGSPGHIPGHHPGRWVEHGCTLFASVPNPCDPDSNN